MKKTSNAFGTASLVCGILSTLLFLAPYFGLPLGAVAIVFYGIQVKKYTPTGMATTGLVLGIIGVVVNLAMLLFILMAFAVMGI